MHPKEIKKDHLCKIPKGFVQELKLSLTEAHVLQELCFSQTLAKTAKDGKLWFSRPIARRGDHKGQWYRPIADCAPWLCPQRLHKIIVSPANSRRVGKSKRTTDYSLEKLALIEIDRNFHTDNWTNKYGTLGYHVPEHVMKMYMESGNKDLLFLSRDDAMRFKSVDRAIVFNILCRSFKSYAYGDGEEEPGTIHYDVIAKQTGLTVRAVKRIIRYFVDKRVLASFDGGKKHKLTMPNPWKGKRSRAIKKAVAYDDDSYRLPVPDAGEQSNVSSDVQVVEPSAMQPVQTGPVNPMTKEQLEMRSRQLAQTIALKRVEHHDSSEVSWVDKLPDKDAGFTFKNMHGDLCTVLADGTLRVQKITDAALAA